MESGRLDSPRLPKGAVPTFPWGFCHNFLHFFLFFSSHPSNNYILATQLVNAYLRSPSPFRHSAIPIFSSFCLDPTTTREYRHPRSPAVVISASDIGVCRSATNLAYYHRSAGLLLVEQGKCSQILNQVNDPA